MTNEEAIGWLESLERLDKEQDVALAMAIEALQERKTGKWEYFNLLRTCSVCRNTTGEKDDFNDWLPNKYCPNCGAKMEVDDGINR